MNKPDFIKLVKNEARTPAWFSGTYTVNASQVGIKLYGKWVQRISVETPTSKFIETIPEQKTLKALAEKLEALLDGV